MRTCNVTLKECTGTCSGKVQDKSIRFADALSQAVRKSRAADAQLIKQGKKPVFMKELNKILSPLQISGKCPHDNMKLAERVNRIIDKALQETGLMPDKTESDTMKAYKALGSS